MGENIALRQDRGIINALVIVSAKVVDAEQMISKWGLGGLMNAWFLFADRLREK